MADLFDALGVGARVVARYRLPDGVLTDALGEIVYIGAGEDYVPDADRHDAAEAQTPHADAPALDADKQASAPAGAGRVVVVRTRRGDVVVPTSRITHAKPVPPPPQRRGPRAHGG